MASFSGVQDFWHPHLPENRPQPLWQDEPHEGAPQVGSQPQSAGAAQVASGAQHEASGAAHEGSQPHEDPQWLFLQENKLCKASRSGVQCFFLQQLVAQVSQASQAEGAAQVASGAQQVGSGAQQVAATGAQQEGFGMQQRGFGVQHFGV
ncbi:hypothetical protein DTL42_08345 [Bremerella cremea]|uniref:Uncharacterized protein n=1 Tax=Bremerella cremea TaxID=1031537 RepID=A0A368KVC0_9BACT|nr:hypothetical protein [Bremerella cremea]RCS52832.1 hypothetical protein DTL42_08345 [Bremerella cremea]